MAKPMITNPSLTQLRYTSDVTSDGSTRTRSHLDLIGAPPPGVATAPGSAGPDLSDVLALVRQRAPAVTGLVIRNGQLLVAYAEPPDESTRATARAALADEAALAELAARRAAQPAATAASTTSEALRAQVLDDSLSDEAWLRAFRRYQVAQLTGDALRAAAPPGTDVADGGKPE